MEAVFDIKQLFGNEYNSVMVLDYKRILLATKEYIECVENCIAKRPDADPETFEHVCSLFAMSMVEYAKAAIDNMVIGHIKAANILNRTFIENYVCLKIIMEYRDEELWKYWMTHSSYNTPRKYGADELPDRIKGHFEKMCLRLEIEPEFLDKKIIERDYGWIWKISRNFNFRELCDKISSRIYEDYKMMCEFTHGTSLFQKVNSFTMESSIINMLSIVYLYLYQLMTTCFPEVRDHVFYECDDKLVKMFEVFVEND